MTFRNAGTWDRGIRLLGGATLVAVGWSGSLAGGLGTAAIAVGVVLLATGLIGWCPAYMLVGFSSCRTR